MSLVGVLNADTGALLHDFRASERLFAQLMQVSGRAGRAGLPGEVLVQNALSASRALSRAWAPRLRRLRQFDAGRAARRPLAAVRSIRRCCAPRAARSKAALAFLQQAAAELAGIPAAERVTVYDAVPLTIVKVMHVHRAQLLVESASRAALQATLRAWQPLLRGLKGVLRWSLEVDPLDI